MYKSVVRNDFLGKQPIAMISVHKCVRELDAKIYLSLELIDKGFNVILGRSSSLIRSAHLLPKGIYCDVRHLSTRRKHFESFKSAGSIVVAFDEEASSITDTCAYLERSVDVKTISLCEQCYCWGEYHKSLAIKRVSLSLGSKFWVVGHPRFDLLREPGKALYAVDVERIRARFGQYILIASNSGGWVISGKCDEKYESYVKRNLVLPTSSAYARFREAFEHRRERHKSLVALVLNAADHSPFLTFIIRPHFTETHEQWEQSLGKIPANVKIIHEGPSIPWIMAAQAVIHSSCTSGTEAFLAGTPCISYRAIRDERFDAKLPNSLSVEATTPDDVIVLLEKWNSDPSSYERDYRGPKLDLFDQYFAAREGETSAQRVAKAMSEISFTDQGNVERFEKLLTRNESEGIGRVAYQSLKNQFRSIIGSFKKRNASSEPVEPKITHQMVKDRLEHLKEYMNWGDEKRLQVIDLGGEMFVITLAHSRR